MLSPLQTSGTLHATCSWQAMRQSGGGCIILPFFCGNNWLGRAETAQAALAGAGSLVMLHIMCGRQPQSLPGYTRNKPLISQPHLKLVTLRPGVDLCCAVCRILVCPKVIQTIRPDVICYSQSTFQSSHNFAKTFEHRSAVAGIWVRVRLT